MRDDPLTTVFAEPLPDDIMTWHVNLVAPDGPYVGLPLHCVLTIPADYPISPPVVNLPVLIPHPNVFSSSFICLDLLRSSASSGPYTGWSSAYTLQSVLLQLQTFLFGAFEIGPILLTCLRRLCALPFSSCV